MMWLWYILIALGTSLIVKGCFKIKGWIPTLLLSNLVSIVVCTIIGICTFSPKVEVIVESYPGYLEDGKFKSTKISAINLEEFDTIVIGKQTEVIKRTEIKVDRSQGFILLDPMVILNENQTLVLTKEDYELLGKGKDILEKNDDSKK